ncbi:hypothetical protein L0222_04940 [bacterium]|nr:hypothetical protein [bacterium]MCI0603348.1 hypothetical protein [bacterium]
MKVFELFFLVLILPALSYPCSCVFPTFEEQWETASAVFRGKVIRVEPQQEGKRRIELEVVKNWKGPDEKVISVFSAEDSAMCGYPFETGKEYLVFATGKDKLHVSLCSRTKQIAEADEDLHLLEKKEGKKESKRDPFSEQTGERIQSDKLIPRELNVTHAVIVGITQKGNEFGALIRATNNKVYFLKVGDKLHDGTVLKIDKNSVTFRKYKGYRSVLVKKQLRPFPDP